MCAVTGGTFPSRLSLRSPLCPLLFGGRLYFMPVRLL